MTLRTFPYRCNSIPSHKTTEGSNLTSKQYQQTLHIRHSNTDSRDDINSPWIQEKFHQQRKLKSKRLAHCDAFASEIRIIIEFIQLHVLVSGGIALCPITVVRSMKRDVSLVWQIWVCFIRLTTTLQIQQTQHATNGEMSWQGNHTHNSTCYTNALKGIQSQWRPLGVMSWRWRGYRQWVLQRGWESGGESSLTCQRMDRW